MIPSGVRAEAGLILCKPAEPVFVTMTRSRKVLGLDSVLYLVGLLVSRLVELVRLVLAADPGSVRAVLNANISMLACYHAHNDNANMLMLSRYNANHGPQLSVLAC